MELALQQLFFQILYDAVAVGCDASATAAAAAVFDADTNFELL